MNYELFLGNVVNTNEHVLTIKNDQEDTYLRFYIEYEIFLGTVKSLEVTNFNIDEFIFVFSDNQELTDIVKEYATLSKGL